MKDVIKKILREEQVDLFGGSKSYKLCSNFTDKDENELCIKLNGLSSWLHSDEGLGLNNIINDKLSTFKDLQDLNDQYQEPLEILYATKKYPEIKFKNGNYYHKGLESKGLVYGDDGKWHHVNKLNTNFGDLAELLTELLKRGGMVKKLNTKNELGLRKYLTSIKDKLSRVMDKYIDVNEYKEFVRNTKTTSQRGEKAENHVRNVLERFGMKTLYQGGDGDFIDMLFGTDLIMSYKDKTYTIQVKYKESQLDSARENYRYKKIDYFAAPTNIGIVVYNKKGESFMVDNSGQLIK